MRRLKYIFLLLLLSCRENPTSKKVPRITASLLKTVEMDYPSGSSLNFYNDSLYLMGDDAREIVVLDTAFELHRSLVLFPGKNRRQRKSFKADIEAGSLRLIKNRTELVLFGSGSASPYRDSLFILNIQTKHLDRASLLPIYTKFNASGISEVNIEGAVQLKKHLLLANRSNLSHKLNYLLRLDGQSPLSINQRIKLIPLSLDDTTLGVSGLDYYKKKDLLFLTLSSEATPSATADGKIGNSALAVINSISRKLEADSLRVDALIPLQNIHKAFHQKKIESVAIGRREQSGLMVYLAADNDDGKTILYKVKLKF